MKKYILLAIAFISSCHLYAQQDPLYSQYLNNPIVLNPAYTGINDVFTASMGYRGQWNGLEGAPTTFYATAHSSLLDNKIGAGLTIIRDEVGVNTNTQVNLSGSYKIEFNNYTFSFGMQTGINAYSEDNSDLLLSDPNDPVFGTNEQFTKVNFGAGAILKGDRFFIGLSVPRLINSKEEVALINEEVEIFSRHYYLGLGYAFTLNSNLALKTGALIKAVSDVPASVDFSASVLIKDKYSVGALTRNLETYGLLLGALINDNLHFNYTFEIPTDQSVGSQFNTHEITLAIDLELFDGHFIKPRYF